MYDYIIYILYYILPHNRSPRPRPIITIEVILRCHNRDIQNTVILSEELNPARKSLQQILAVCTCGAPPPSYPFSRAAATSVCYRPLFDNLQLLVMQCENCCAFVSQTVEYRCIQDGAKVTRTSGGFCDTSYMYISLYRAC